MGEECTRPYWASITSVIFIARRQSSRVTETDRAGESVGFGTEFIGAGAEHFAGGTDLNVYFQTDNGFVFHFWHKILEKIV